MADKVLFQTDDDLDQVNLSEVANKSNQTDYVERGLGFTADHTAETLDVESGHANITNGTEAYDVFPDKKTGLDLATTSGTNYVFLWIDTDDDDTLGYYISDTDSAPSASDVSADGPIASLKVGEVDAGGDTHDDTINDDPDISIGIAEIDPQDLTDSGAPAPSNDHTYAHHDGSGSPAEGLYRSDSGNSQWVKVEDNTTTISY